MRKSYGKTFTLGVNNVSLKQHILDNRDLCNIPRYLFWCSMAVKQIQEMYYMYYLKKLSRINHP